MADLHDSYANETELTEKEKKKYKKTRDALKNKPRHFYPGEEDKTQRQRRRENMRIRVRKIKRLNVFLTLLLIIVLSAAFYFSATMLKPLSKTPEVLPNSDNTLTVNFVGDIMLGRYIEQKAASEGGDAVYGGVAPLLEGADLTFADLDCAVLKKDVSKYHKEINKVNLSCTLDSLQSAQKAGINVFAASNNHIYDYGSEPVTDLIDYFNSDPETYYNGIGKNLEDAAKFTLIEKNGYKIAFLSISDVYYEETCAGKDKAGILSTVYASYNQLVHNASEIADFTVVYFYWGVDDDISRTKTQRSIGHHLIDAGADIVIGTHPHVLQEVEKYKEGIIFYSLGNFIFDDGDSFSRDSVMVQLSLDKKGEASFSLYPLRINDGVPALTANPLYKARITHELTQKLSKDEYSMSESGNIVIPFGKTITSASGRPATPSQVEKATVAPTEIASEIPTQSATDAVPSTVPSATAVSTEPTTEPRTEAAN